jgi:hypothetical protein
MFETVGRKSMMIKQEMFHHFRPELAWKNLPSRPPVRGDHVDKAPTVVGGGVPDVRVKEVQDNQEVHHQVDAWQDDQAVAVHDDVHTCGDDDQVDAWQEDKYVAIHDDVPTGGCDDQDQGRLVEDVTKDAKANGGSARPKRPPKPQYSPDDYALSYVETNRGQGGRKSKITKQGVFDPGGGPDDYDLSYVSSKPRTKSRRSIRRARKPIKMIPFALEGEEGA